MWFAVQQLLRRGAIVDRPAQAGQSGEEELAVCVGQLWREIRVGNDVFRLRNPIGEASCHHIDLAHTDVQALQRVGELDRRDVRCHGFVVRPQRDCESILRVHERIHPRVQRAHRAAELGEVLRELDFELGNLLPYRSDPGHDVAGQQPQRQLVRVVQSDGVTDQ